MKTCPMVLNMYINNELIDTVAVTPTTGDKVNVNEYRHQLLLKHSARLALEDQAPVFTLEGVPSRVNRPFSSLTDTYELPGGDDPLFPRSKKNKE